MAATNETDAAEENVTQMERAIEQSYVNAVFSNDPEKVSEKEVDQHAARYV